MKNFCRNSVWLCEVCTGTSVEMLGLGLEQTGRAVNTKFSLREDTYLDFLILWLVSSISAVTPVLLLFCEAHFC